MANASIFSQYVKPVRSMQDYANDYDVAEQNKLALAAKRMEMQRAEAGMQDQQRIRGLSAQYGSDENALIKALRGGGYFEQAGGLEKQIAERLKGQGERDKTAAEIDERRFKLAKERRDAYEAARGGFERDPQLSKDKVVRVLAEMGDIGVLPAELVQKLTANLPDDPEALRADIRTGNLSRLTPEQMVTLFTPKYEFQDSGQQRIPVQMNMNVPGAVAPQTIQKVATPGEVLTDTRTRAEGAANRGVQIRGQNLTDARAKDANKIAGSLADQKKQLEVDALKDKAAERDRSKQAAVSSVESQIRVIDKALSHPGMKTATGLSGTIDPRNYVAGTDATDFRVVLDQIGGAAFLQAFESLKGGGAITEVEGKKATDAIARLNRAQSDSEFETSLNELRGVMETGYKRLAGRDYARPNVPPKPAGGAPARVSSDADYNALPSGATFVGPDGKTRRKP